MQLGWQTACHAFIRSQIQFPVPQKHSMVDGTCNLSTEEGKVEESDVQSHHQLYGEFEDYMRL